MNKKPIFLVLLVCLLAFIAVLAFGQSSPTVRWEYTTTEEIKNREQLNALGAQGWELVTVSKNSSSGDNTLWWKRRLP